MKKIFVLSVALVLLQVASLSAQMMGAKFQDKELKSKMSEYHKENICPQWSIWKSKIDNSLSKEDFEKLNSLRDNVRKTLAEKRECMQECMKNNLNTKDSTSFNNNGKGKGFGKGKRHGNKMCKESCGIDGEKQKFRDELKSILSNYDNLIKQIIDEAKPFHEKWQEDKDKIIQSYYADKNDDSNKKYRGFKNNKGKSNHNDNMHKNFIAKLALWDGNCNLENEDILDFDNKLKSDNKQVTVYPNPFTDQSNITFNLESQSKVKLTVNNSNGVEITKLFEGNLNAGEHTYTLKADNLTPGVYIYHLSINGKLLNGKIVLNK